MKEKRVKPNRFSDMAKDIKEWKSGAKKLKTTTLDSAGGRSVFHATGTELAVRTSRAEAFKRIRADLKMSQPELAKAMHVGTATVRNWEYGRRLIPEAMLILAELLRDVPAVRKRLLAA